MRYCIFNNMKIVNEHGADIPYDYSRCAVDFNAIDELCRDLRDPHSYCLERRIRAEKSPYVPAC